MGESTQIRPMQRRIPGVWTGAALGALTSLPVMGVSYLAERLLQVPFIPFDVFDWMARVLPGQVITTTIDLMVAVIRGLNLGPTASTAKLAEQGQAIGLFILTGAVLGAALGVFGRGSQNPVRLGLIAGAVLLIGIIPVELSVGFPQAGPGLSLVWLALLFGAWGVSLVWLNARARLAQEQEPEASISRRQFLYLVGGGTIVVTVGSVGLASLLESGEAEGPATTALPTPDLADTTGPASSPPDDVLARRIMPAPGTRDELTSNEDFYRIDINTRPPEVDGAGWTLQVDGLVEQPLALTLDDLRTFPAVSQVITLECISNPVGGDLISTSRWTGARLKDVLDRAGMSPSATEAYVTAADSFYESITMSDITDPRTLLVYEMNGVPLSKEHGFPLRVYIPNRHGMKQPKWIERIELIDRHGPGYWVDRGWDAQAIVHTTSVVDAVDTAAAGAGSGTVPIGGIAYAGARGISKVEVQVDDGPWVEAVLRAPALSPLSWVQWRYDWPYTSGRHSIQVRAYDGKGQLQVTERRPPSPSGATGIDSLIVNL
ncbi:MAG TPA: molybdopterin-dependent oxidoreductase [Anaerolineales bacterium]|nr:molybdopterin-dependent oxidoreductase [Anaerolineales bacterium]